MHQLLKRDIHKLNVIEQVVDAGVLLQHARLAPEPAGGGVGVFEHFDEGMANFIRDGLSWMHTSTS